MNLPELHRQLISAARQATRDEHVPYAFEKRITALIKDRVAQKNQDFWARGLWRAALSCIAIAVMCGAWTMFFPSRSHSTTDDFSQNFENTLLATVDQSESTP